MDFGACRTFDKRFTDEYLRVVHAAAKKDREGVLEASRALGFLGNDENKIMIDAHLYVLNDLT